MIYWTLKKTTANETLPVLRRTGSQGNSIGFTPGFGVDNVYKNITAVEAIDVVNNFQWTKSPKSSRYDAPSAFLKEKRIVINSNISNLANSVIAGVESVGNAFGSQSTEIVNNVRNSIVTGSQDAANRVRQLPTSSDIVKNIINQGYITSDTARAIADKTAETIESVSKYEIKNPVLRPYSFLYATEPTGFEYILPYFQNEFQVLNNSFGNADSFLLFDAIEGFAEGVTDYTNILKPGTYIERSKQFEMSDMGRPITIKFPLLNTIAYTDIIDNWQLIFGIVYQNRPGRVTRSIIDLPVIYELNIPGVVYMPFCFISNMVVEFQGNRREMTIKVPVGSDTTSESSLRTIIPDAYQVSITLTGLNEETRNFIYSSILPDPVTTS